MVRKKRRKREKAEREGEAEQEPAKAEGTPDGEATNDAEAELPAFETDFPFDEVNKSEYKTVNEVGATFGNDKLVSGRNFRPSFVLSSAQETVVVAVPTRVLEEAIKKLANTGENKEKTDFFRQFQWFVSFT